MSIDLGGGTVIERISSASRLVSDEDPLSIDGDGEGESPPQLGRFGISAVSPNPFNPAVNVEFAVERSALVVLEVFALDGRRVKTLVSETLPAGRHEVTWGGVDSDGVGVASGVYLFRMRAEGKVYIGRGTLLK